LYKFSQILIFKQDDQDIIQSAYMKEKVIKDLLIQC
jgi:hypothetical protein